MNETRRDPKVEILGEATSGGRLPAMGRTRETVYCTCGHRNTFYLWSWAGHGKAKCGGCDAWINRDYVVYRYLSRRGRNGQIGPEYQRRSRA